MPDQNGLDFTIAAQVGGGANNNPLNMLNSVANFQENMAHAQLYNLQGAVAARNFNALQQYGLAAAQGNQAALEALTKDYPEGAQVVSTVRNNALKNAQDQYNMNTRAAAQLAAGVLSVDPSQRMAVYGPMIDQQVQNRVIAPQMGQMLKSIVNNPVALQGLVNQGLSPAEFNQSSGITPYFEARGKLAGEAPGRPPIQLPQPNPRAGEPGQPQNINPYFTPGQFPGNEINPPGPGGYFGTSPGGGTSPKPQSSITPGQFNPAAGNPFTPAAFRMGNLQGPSTQGPASGAMPGNAWLARLYEGEGGKLTSANPSSTARGPAQFIESTWLDQMHKLHPELDNVPDSQILALRQSPRFGMQLNQEATLGYAQDNAKYLSDSGLPVNATTLALAHRLGPEGAAQVLQAAPNAPMRSVVGDKAASVNPDIARMNVGTFIRTYANKFGNSVPDFIQSAETAQAGPNAPPPNTLEPTLASVAGPAASPVPTLGTTQTNPEITPMARPFTPLAPGQQGAGSPSDVNAQLANGQMAVPPGTLRNSHGQPYVPTSAADLAREQQTLASLRANPQPWTGPHPNEQAILPPQLANAAAPTTAPAITPVAAPPGAPTATPAVAGPDQLLGRPAPSEPATTPETKVAGAIPGTENIPYYNPAEMEGIKGQISAAQKQNDAQQTLANGARSGMQSIHTLDAAFDLLKTGKLADAELKANEWFISLMDAMHIPVSDKERQDASIGKLISIAGGNLALDRVRSLGPREAVQVVQYVRSLKPELTNLNEQNKMITDALRQDFQRSIDKAKFMDDWVNPDIGKHSDFRHAAQTFEDQHPVQQYASRVLPLPMPRNVKEAIPDTYYMTKQGRALWDGHQFIKAQ
jgi:hypothetical protein